jgi:hypothetical protein
MTGGEIKGKRKEKMKSKESFSETTNIYDVIYVLLFA